MEKFEVGKVYSCFSVCNQDCIFSYKVIKRTEKTVVLKDMKHEAAKEKRFRINKEWSEVRNAETVFPLGSYSMAPTLSADFVED